MKSKQLNKGVDQLMDEGVAQMFVNQFNGRKIIGTVGQLQFEVIQYRLENEYNAKCRWEPVHLYKACWIDSDDPAELMRSRNANISIWLKIRTAAMCSWLIQVMSCRWHSRTLSISDSILLVNFNI